VFSLTGGRQFMESGWAGGIQMNRRPPGLKLSKALLGFWHYKAAEALSPRTLEGYQHDLQKWLDHIGDVDVGEISSEFITQIRKVKI
jgi:hypothetical protein